MLLRPYSAALRLSVAPTHACPEGSLQLRRSPTIQVGAVHRTARLDAWLPDWLPPSLSHLEQTTMFHQPRSSRPEPGSREYNLPSRADSHRAAIDDRKNSVAIGCAQFAL